MQHISVHAPFLITRGTQISEEFEIFTDTYTFSNSFCMYFFLTPQLYFFVIFHFVSKRSISEKLACKAKSDFVANVVTSHYKIKKITSFWKRLITVLPETWSTWVIVLCCTHVLSTPGDRIRTELLINFATPTTRWVMNDPRKTNRSRFLKTSFTFVRTPPFLSIHETCYHHNWNCNMMAFPIIRRVINSYMFKKQFAKIWKSIVTTTRV